MSRSEVICTQAALKAVADVDVVIASLTDLLLPDGLQAA